MPSTARDPEIITAAAAKHPHILSLPSGPACGIKEFGEKAVIFGLGYWVAGTNGFISEVHFLVWNTLKEAGIPLVPVK